MLVVASKGRPKGAAYVRCVVSESTASRWMGREKLVEGDVLTDDGGGEKVLVRKDCAGGGGVGSREMSELRKLV